MSNRSEEKLAYWRGVLERQRESGKNIRWFCREAGISEASFHSWKRKIVASGQDTQPPEGSAVFIPIRMSASAGSALELVHPRGHVLRVPAVFDEGSLHQVLNVLDRQGEK